jgi:hypothetical protein
MNNKGGLSRVMLPPGSTPVSGEPAAFAPVTEIQIQIRRLRDVL